MKKVSVEKNGEITRLNHLGNEGKMAVANLAITGEISSSFLADLALRTFQSTSLEIQELLLQSKNEQTFSGLLAAALQKKESVAPGSALVEIKGVNYTQRDSFSRNFHDIAIVNQDAQSEILIENKVWYHFDGAKGKKTAKIEPNVISELKDDIYKVQLTLSQLDERARAFILVHIVTPADIERIPKSYLSAHRSSFARVGGDWDRYRREGLDGISNSFSLFKSNYKSSVEIKSANARKNEAQGFIDIFCVEVKR
jgi:hypothetical protein